VFTGLIESLGTLRGSTPIAGGRRLTIETDLAHDLAPGDSLAVNGVCLTIVKTGGGRVETDVSPETLRVTNLGSLEAGARINLERPVRPTAVMGGHFVQGHVDATGTISGIGREGDFWRVTIAHPPALAPLLIPKGSVAVDGISLTVAALADGQFDVQIIPHTWTRTNLHDRRVGEQVNLEGDMIGKYVVRIAELSALGRTNRAAGSQE
jgi:riboflavin synthase